MPVSKLILVALLVSFLQSPSPSYKAEMEQWRGEREKAVKFGLTLAGLFWLKEGKNSVGTDPGSAIVLPKGSGPGKLGVFEFHHGATTFEPAPGVEATVNGEPATAGVLKPDSSGSPDTLRVRDLTMFVIQRGQRYGIRLRDENSEARKAFAGLKYFSVNESYRIKASFVPYAPAKKIAILNILGDTEDETSPGYVVFILHGHEFRLDPILDGDKLFFIFKDLTAGEETYPNGRFLFTEMPKGGEVVLDFNKAINPPCAFTPFSTCPLPPKQNHLAVRIEAGELRYGHSR